MGNAYLFSNYTFFVENIPSKENLFKMVLLKDDS